MEYVRSLRYDLTPFSLEWDAVLSRRVDEINAAEPLLKHINAARRFPQFLVSGFSDVFSFSPDLQIRAWIKGAPDRTLVRYVLENPFVAFVRFGLGPAFWIPTLLGGALSMRRWREMVVFALAPSWFIFYNIYSHFENRNVVVGMWGAVVFFAVAILWLLDRLLLWRRGEENPLRDTKPGDAD
jgi:hypothetical protein